MSTTATPDGIPLTPDVPGPLTTPPGVPSAPTKWYGEPPKDADGDRITYALFSGGDDSLVSTHKAIEDGDADAVLHLNTNTGLAENFEYVVDVCRHFEWPLRVEASPVSLVEMGMKFGFPGSAYHAVAYAYLKERQLSSIAGEQSGPPDYVTGVRKFESDRRMKNVSGDGVRSEGKGGRWYWVRPINDWRDEDVVEYRESHDLPRNPVAKKIHRSGDCYCGAFAHRDELFIDLYAEGYDRHATWLRAVETRVKEYRGRLAIFEREYPEEFDAVEERRDEYNPKPMRLSVARHLFPDVAEAIDSIPITEAVDVGRQDERNYWGHGKMSNSELQSLLAKHNPEQMELCMFCDEPSL